MTNDYQLFQSYADDEIISAVVDVLERESWWIKGPEIEKLEREVAELTGREYAIAVNSGTSALYATLESIGIEGKEVILPSFTYQATANAVVAAGGQPVFADIEPDSYGLSAGDVKERITEQTVGIIPVHFGGGITLEINKLQTIASEYDLFLVEDSAHSLGATLHGVPAGAFGDAATFSFAFNKIITTGQGGMVVTDDSRLAKKVRKLRIHGRDSNGEYSDWGMNLIMSSIHAAIGVAQMSNLEMFIDRRQEMAKLYNKLLSDVQEIRTHTVSDEVESVYFLYNILLPGQKTRNELQEYLDERGIPTKVYFQPCHLSEYYSREWNQNSKKLSVTKEISGRILSLPFHLGLTNDDIEYISSEISSFFSTMGSV